MRTAFACILGAGVAIAGCGGSSARAPLAAQDSAALRQDVSAIRAAAAASNPSAADAAAARLRADVQRLLGEGRLSSADAQSILIAIGHVDGRISAEVHSPAPPVATPSLPTPAPAAAPPTRGPAPTPAAHGHAPAPAPGKGPDHGPGPGGKHAGD